MSKKVLVTGCAGFIGSNLVAKCIEKGWAVHGVDDLSSGRRQFVPSDMHFMHDDFASKTILKKVESGEFDYVIHLAAVPRVSYSVEHPIETHETNVEKTLRLVDKCSGRVKRFVFASSSSVYGGADILPTPDTHPKDPKSPYALQKSIIEDYLKLYYKLYGLDSVSLRFFNVFGPNQLGNSPYSTAVSAWLNAIMKNESMRSDGDGSQSRDMCYVDNVVDACVRSVECTGELSASVLNVACGDRTSNADILKYLKKKFPSARSHEAPWRAGDVMHTQADITRTTEVLGYTPLVRFWEGLDKTIEWHEKSWHVIKDM